VPTPVSAPTLELLGQTIEEETRIDASLREADTLAAPTQESATFLGGIRVPPKNHAIPPPPAAPTSPPSSVSASTAFLVGCAVATAIAAIGYYSCR
jgi:hypothetical protein